MVFSCGALHEVTPITKGRRYAFLPFLYGESDAKKSLENDALLRKIGVSYERDQHRLYPEDQPQGSMTAGDGHGNSENKISQKPDEGVPRASDLGEAG
jgi:hypothetical protein